MGNQLQSKNFTIQSQKLKMKANLTETCLKEKPILYQRQIIVNIQGAFKQIAFSKMNEQKKLIEIFSHKDTSDEKTQGQTPMNIMQSMNSYPYSNVGWLSILFPKQTARGTGTLITPQIILTCAHNVYQREYDVQKCIKCLGIYFFYPEKNQYVGEPLQVQQYYIPAQYKTCDYHLKSNWDIALLKLTKPIKSQIIKKFIPICNFSHPQRELKDKTINIFGYPYQSNLKIDPTGTIYYQFNSSGKIIKIIKNCIFYSASTQKGVSGSPIIAQIDGEDMIIGIHTTGHLNINSGILLHKNILIQSFNLENCLKLQLQRLIYETKNNSQVNLSSKSLFYPMKLQFNNISSLIQLKIMHKICKKQLIKQQTKILSLMNNKNQNILNQNYNLLTIISLFKNIQKLQLGWCTNSSEQSILKLFGSIRSKNIKYITLLNGYKFMSKQLLSFAHKKFQNLQIFDFGHKTNSKYIYKYYDDSQFLNVQIPISNDIQNQSQLILTLSIFQNLKNFWIRKPLKKQNAQILYQRTSLQNICLGQYDLKQLIDKKLINYLKNQTKLTSLTVLGNYYGQQQDINKMLIQIVSNNPSLKSIIIDGIEWSFNNKLINEDFIIKIQQKLPLIQTLVIRDTNAKLNINALSGLKKLSLLDLTECKNINGNSFCMIIKQIEQLKYLILMLNPQWVNDQVLISIGKTSKKLKLLNIHGTSITDNGLIKVENLKNLQTLICGNNKKINGKGIKQLIKKSNKIEKLSINMQNGYYHRGKVSQQDIICIDKYNKNGGITHLNIIDCTDIGLQCLLQLKKLKVVKIGNGSKHLNKKQIRILQQKNINVIQLQVFITYDI